MRLKIFITYLMIMLCFIMGSMAEIPHHHHNGVICVNFNHIKNHHSENNHNHNDCNNCCHKTIDVYKSQEKEKAAKSDSYSLLPDNLIIRIENCLLSLDSDSSPSECSYIEKLHSRFLFKSKGLRSPPFLS